MSSGNQKKPANPFLTGVKWTVEITVGQTWIEDGYELTAENLHEAILSEELPFATETEVVVKVLKKVRVVA